MTLAAEIRRRSAEPVDIASLALFRVLFGLLLCGSVVRFALKGWVDVQYVQPRFFFKYFGFAWVPVPPRPVLQAEYALLALLALAIAAGLFYRASLALFLAGFLHVQLMDVTNYLNHYYLVVLLLALLLVLPAGDAFSIDARRRPGRARRWVPAWMVWLLRFQVGIVYFFAAVAKVTPDWLLNGQPLGLWLRSRAELPLLGPLFMLPSTALAMSWAGFLFDLTVPFLLLWSRVRPWVYVVIVVFHGLTNALFDIGIFPLLMPVATLLFWPPDWPRRLPLLRRWLQTKIDAPPTASLRRMPWLVPVWCAVHLLVPLRAFAMGGDVNWREDGMRFSWRVMVREKSGSVTYEVHAPATGRRWQVDPLEYLTPRQAREMSTQPDLILQLAHHIGKKFAERHGVVEVRAQTSVSLNGRAPAPLVDPAVDLMTVRDGLWRKEWVLPSPPGPPAPLGMRDNRRAEF